MVTKDAWMASPQANVSHGLDIELGDISSAFLNGNPFKREKGPLYCELPPDGVPGVEAGSLLEVLVCVYGLGGRPAQLVQELRSGGS